jgi:hypothetical protein
MRSFVDFSVGVVCAGLLPLAVGCAAGAEANDEVVGQVEEAARTRSHFYFRCNATSWGVNDDSRLVARGEDADVVELEYDVRKQWMVDGGDDCIVTETPRKNAWGAWQRDYGLEGSEEVGVPLADFLRPAAAGEQIKIHVTYPSRGHYRVVLNTREHWISLRSEEVSSGQIAWETPGSLFAGPHKALFNLATPLEGSAFLSRIGDDGKSRWSYELSPSAELAQECIYEDAIVVKNGTELVAVEPMHGKKLWALPLQSAEDWVICPSGGHLVFTETAQHDENYNLLSQALNAVRREQGGVVFSHEVSRPADLPEGTFWELLFLGATNDEVAVATTGLPQSSISVLEARSGGVRWSHGYNWVNQGATVDARGRVYLSENDFETNTHRIQRLSRSTGNVTWEIDRSADGWASLLFGTLGETYLVTPSSLTKVDPGNGRVAWRFAGPSPDQSIAPTLLDEGRVLIGSSNTDATETYGTLLDPSGRVAWRRTFAGSGSFITDPSGHVYFHGENTLSLLRDDSGKPRWTFTHVPTGPADNLGWELFSDDSHVFAPYAIGRRFPSTGLYELDLKSGAMRWKTPTFGSGYKFLKSTGKELVTSVRFRTRYRLGASFRE